MRWVVALAALAGCSSVELAPNAVTYRAGVAGERAVRRVVAVRASCGSLSSFNRTIAIEGAGAAGAARRETDSTPASRTDNPGYRSGAVACTDKQIDGVDQAVRSELEFRGYSVIDSERVNAVTASRIETVTRELEVGSDGSRSSSVDRQAVTTGSLFGDAPPAIQDQILGELEADGLLNARIFVGAPIARSPRRNVYVQVRLVEVPSGDLVWASRCRVNAGWDVNEVAIMRAARCAMARISASR